MQVCSEMEPLFDNEQLDLLRDALGEAELAAMLSELPAAASGSLHAINAAIGAGNLEEARKAAHVLKGFSSSLGAARIAAFAREIELELETIAAVAGRMPLLIATIDATVEDMSRMAAGA
jgi:HPt (histidine-containing phosphotransfer) domain-containing protein